MAQTAILCRIQSYKTPLQKIKQIKGQNRDAVFKTLYINAFSLPKYNYEIMETRFNRVRSFSNIIVSSVLVIAGVSLVVTPTPVSVNIFGMTLATAGIILFLTLKTAYKDAQTGETFNKSEKYFPVSKMESLSKALAADPAKIDLKEENTGNGLRIDVYYNKKSGHSFAQLLEYVPYKYQPCSPVYSYEIARVESLIK